MSAILMQVLVACIVGVLGLCGGWVMRSTNWGRNIAAKFSNSMGTDTGIRRVYSGGSDAKADMEAACKKSAVIRILSMRAFRLVSASAPLNFLLKKEYHSKEIQILLANPDGDAAAARATEFTSLDPSYSEERYLGDVRWSVEQVVEIAKANNISLRLHDETAWCRLLMTDTYLFLSFFTDKIHGDESRVYRVDADSPVYEVFGRYFDWCWKHRSKDVPST